MIDNSVEAVWTTSVPSTCAELVSEATPSRSPRVTSNSIAYGTPDIAVTVQMRLLPDTVGSRGVSILGPRTSGSSNHRRCARTERSSGRKLRSDFDQLRAVSRGGESRHERRCRAGPVGERCSSDIGEVDAAQRQRTGIDECQEQVAEGVVGEFSVEGIEQRAEVAACLSEHVTERQLAELIGSEITELGRSEIDLVQIDHAGVDEGLHGDEAEYWLDVGQREFGGGTVEEIAERDVAERVEVAERGRFARDTGTQVLLELREGLTGGRIDDRADEVAERDGCQRRTEIAQRDAAEQVEWKLTELEVIETVEVGEGQPLRRKCSNDLVTVDAGERIDDLAEPDA